MSRDGKQWSKLEEEKLLSMFYEGYSYYEMSKELDRTWFACKCRLIKLKLLPFEKKEKEMPFMYDIEKYDVPFKNIKKEYISSISMSTWVNKEEGDTSRTFSNTELNIVIDYFKTRLAKLALQKLDSKSFVKGIEIQTVEEIFKGEISKIRMAKDMTIEQREKILFRLV